MSIEVPYSCHVDQKVTTMNCDDPMLPIVLYYGDTKIKTDALVDSGCTVSHANMAIAKRLGIPLMSPPCVESTTYGIAGLSHPLVGYLIDVDFQIEGQDYKFSGPILFVENLPYQVLLGQRNFFDHYNVTFKKSEKVFLLDQAL